jgi:hypothetical protein
MNPSTQPHAPRGLVFLAAPLLLATLIIGCASSGKDVTGFDSVTLAPGDTGNCNSSPCQVYLKMPAGTGSYEVTANEVSVGTFPAGRTAFLGSFWQSQAFQIRGMDAPKAYAWIPVQR